MICCSAQHTVFVSEDGALQVLGNNSFGQCGLGDVEDTLVPMEPRFELKERLPLVQVACSPQFSAFLDAEVLWWTGTIDEQHTVRLPQIFTLFDVRIVACGFDFIIAYDGNNVLWGKGSNIHGQLGSVNAARTNGADGFCQLDTNIQDTITDIKCGFEHTVLITAGNVVWGTGKNVFGQLGMGNFQEAVRQFTTPLLPKNITITAICCGFEHTLLLASCGSVWATGANQSAQLGKIGMKTSRFKKISKVPPIAHLPINCAYGTALIDRNGGVWVCGDNSLGQLGLGTWEGVVRPCRITSIPKMIAISMSPYHTVMVSNEGELWGCGNGGCLGLDDLILSLQKLQTPRMDISLAPARFRKQKRATS